MPRRKRNYKPAIEGYGDKTRTEYAMRRKRRQSTMDRSRNEANRRSSILKAARSAARKSGGNVGTKQGGNPRLPGTR